MTLTDRGHHLVLYTLAYTLGFLAMLFWVWHVLLVAIVITVLGAAGNRARRVYRERHPR